MKRSFLTFLIIVGIVLITCGNEPREDFYEGTPEDSAAIAELLENFPELLVTDDVFIPELVYVDMPDVEFLDADRYFRDVDSMVKQLVDSCGLELTEFRRFPDFWFAKDTTCTVYFYDTFTVISLMHYDERHTGYYFWGNDTDPEIDTIIVDTTNGYDSVEDVIGVGERLIFFEPRRDTVPTVDPETNDTSYALIDPLDWQMKRISYGIYDYPEAGGLGVPGIFRVILDPDGNGPISDTILATSYDTTYTGHAMDRFRSIDSLLEYDDGDTLQVSILLTNAVPGSLCTCLGSIGGENRTYMSWTAAGANGNLVVTGQGITNLYFEAINRDAFYYVQPRKEYQAQVWLIPIRIGGVQ